MRRYALVLMFLTGCSHVLFRSPQGTSVKDTHLSDSGDNHFTLAVEVKAASRTHVGKRSIMPRETLLGGDRVEIFPSTDKPAYIYVVHYSDFGWSQSLFPQTGHRMVAPGEAIRIPEPGVDLVVDSEPADEMIYVLASRRPIDPQTCELLRVDCSTWNPRRPVRGDDGKSKQDPSSKGEPVARQERPPTRDGKLILDGERKFLRLDSDESGQALLAFPFKH